MKILVLLFLFIPFICAAKPSFKPLRVAYTVYPPFEILEKGSDTPTGVFVDFLEDIARKSGVELSWIGPISFPRAIKMVLDGDADIIPSIPLHMAAENGFVFSDKIQFKGYQGIATLTKNPLHDIKSAKDLRGKLIGKFAKGYMPDFFKSPDVTLYEITSMDDAMTRGFQMMRNGRLWGVYLANVDAAPYFAAKSGLAGKVKVLPLPPGSEVFVATIGLSPKLSPKISQIFLKHAERDGTESFQKILKKYVSAAENIDQRSPSPQRK